MNSSVLLAVLTDPNFLAPWNQGKIQDQGDPKTLQRWKEGRTVDSFVNANMIELSRTVDEQSGSAKCRFLFDSRSWAGLVGRS